MRLKRIIAGILIVSFFLGVRLIFSERPHWPRLEARDIKEVEIVTGLNRGGLILDNDAINKVIAVFNNSSVQHSSAQSLLGISDSHRRLIFKFNNGDSLVLYGGMNVNRPGGPMGPPDFQRVYELYMVHYYTDNQGKRQVQDSFWHVEEIGELILDLHNMAMQYQWEVGE